MSAENQHGRDEILAAIRDNLKRAGINADDVRVQPDPYSGWRIAVVSGDFAGMSSSERRRITLDGLADIPVQWLDLLTPSEREWAGTLPADAAPEMLPLWPESLARARLTTPDAVFPSDLDEDLSPPIVATFYSLRGGVGRSTALAYTAHVLAARGKKVVCVDLDVEAPGLAALFGKEAEVGERQGVVQLLIDIDSGESPDVSKHLLRVSDRYDLYCLPAGVPGADYARKLSLIDPDAWYREDRNPLRELMDHLAGRLPFVPDVVLLDSRTGITRLSAPLLFDLADLAFVVFFPHPQARTGTEGLVHALLSSHTRRSSPERPLAPEPRFVVSPIPASKAPEVTQRYRHRSVEWVHEWLARSSQAQSKQWLESEIIHFIPYQEAVATSDEIFTDRDIWSVYVPLAEWIEKFLPTAKEQQTQGTVAQSKSQVLEGLAFSTGTAEHQSHLRETFVETELVTRAFRDDVPLVIGRKGTGKTALFRFLMDDPAVRSLVLLSPTKLRGARMWQLSADGFKTAAEILDERTAEWREFWAIYTCLACHVQGEPGERDALVPHELRQAMSTLPDTERKLLECLQGILTVPRSRLLVTEWLARIDAAASQRQLLLVDGLDTGFGNTPPDHQRRSEAISGLLSFFTDRGETLTKLRFKIVLREDIWKKLRFDNKSHLFGRSVRLAWDSQPDYLTVVLRQALRSEGFRRLVVPDDLARLAAGPVREDDAVYRVWSILVGERMKGGNTTYTSNWVWYRLADANGDRSPRALLQLFERATDWEKKEHKRSPYEKTVLRPRALSASLKEVSKEALSALFDEEFLELLPLRDRLVTLGYTPVYARDLQGLDDEVVLAREVGLLSVYEGTESDPIRYRVPDIYRIGLDMTRRGQL